MLIWLLAGLIWPIFATNCQRVGPFSISATQVSLNHISPLIGGTEASTESIEGGVAGGTSNNITATNGTGFKQRFSIPIFSLLTRIGRLSALEERIVQILPIILHHRSQPEPRFKCPRIRLSSC